MRRKAEVMTTPEIKQSRSKRNTGPSATVVSNMKSDTTLPTAKPKVGFRFMHISDTHLGLRQYGDAERAVDMARSLKDAFEQAVAAQVDFILIAGDFFETQDTNPEAFLHAMDCLRVPKDANIPVYAIAGNHNKAYWSRRECWLDVLNEAGYFHLLAPTFLTGGDLELPMWDEVTRSGAIVEPTGKPYRIIGFPHLGNHTSAMIPKIGQKLPAKDRFNIVMMHLGITGQIAEATDAFEKTILDPIKPRTNFLALGHYHKFYAIDGWIFNPGGTETRSIAELEFPHGFLIVDVDERGTIKHQLHTGKRRPFHVLDEPVSPQDNHETLKARVLAAIKALPESHEPSVITVNVEGTLADRYADIDLAGIEREAKAASGALLVRVRSRIERNDVHVSLTEKAGLDRNVLEAEVLEQVLPTTFMGLDEKTSKDVAAQILSIKSGVLASFKPEDVYVQFERLKKLLPGRPESEGSQQEVAP